MEKYKLYSCILNSSLQPYSVSGQLRPIKISPRLELGLDLGFGLGLGLKDNFPRGQLS